jgi:hypothetical protein
MSVGVVGTAADGGVRADIVAIVVVIVTAIVVAQEQDIAPAIVPDSATRTDKTCTTVSVIRADPRRKVRPATRLARVPALAMPDRTTSMLTGTATLIAEMIRADGIKGRRTAGNETNNRNSDRVDHRVNRANGQAASHHLGPPTIVRPEISN